MSQPRPRFYDEAKRLYLRVMKARGRKRGTFRSSDLWEVLRPNLLELADGYETTRDTFERLHEGILVAEVLTRSLDALRKPETKHQAEQAFMRLPEPMRQTLFGEAIATSSEVEFMRIVRAIELGIRLSPVLIVAPENRERPIRRTSLDWCTKLCRICDGGAAGNYETLAAALYELRSALMLSLEYDLKREGKEGS